MEIIMQPGAELLGTLNKHHGYYIHCRNGRFFTVRHAHGKYPPSGFLALIRDLTRMAGGPIVADIIISDVELNYAIIVAAEKGINYVGRSLHAEDVRAILNERNLL